MRAALVAAALACAAAAPASEVVGTLDAVPALSAALRAIGAHPIAAPNAAETLRPNALAVVAATPAALADLAARREAVERFTAGGGWVVLSGLSAEGLGDFDRLVGVEHLLRPFRSEVVALDPRSPLAHGLSPEDVGMRTDGGNPWQAPVAVAPDAYGPIVDLDNLAPFAAIPEPAWFKHENGDNDRNPFNLVDGFTEADGGWRRAFVFYLNGRSRMDFELALPRPATLGAVEWTGSMVYPGIRKVEVTFDGDAASAATIDVPQGVQVKRLDLRPPRAATRVGFRILEAVDNGRQAVGVDEIRLIPARDADVAARVKPLTSIGALVAYPRGAGGILLCQLRFAEDDDQPTAERKRRILKQLLENLGAELGEPGSGMSAPVVAASGVGEPLDLGAGDARAPRWLGDERHSFSYPAGEVPLRGLRFRLAAPLRAGESRAIAVGRAAESLVFLHAAAVADAADGRLLARYRVVYADGRVVDVPVVAGRDVADCRQRSPRPLPRAALAWLGAPDADALAVVYARQWDNPTPAVAIARIELVGDDPASAVALLAATALPPHAR